MLRRLRQTPRVVLVIVAVSAFVLTLMMVQLTQVKPLAARVVGMTLEQGADGLLVVGLSPGGPADRAGLVVGDRLLTVAGRPVASTGQYEAAARRFQAGTPSAFSVRRSNETLMLAVRPGVPPDWSLKLLTSAVVLLCMIVGAVCLAGRTADVRARLLALVFFLIAVEFALPLGLSEDSWWRWGGQLAFYLLTGAQFATELHLASAIAGPRRGSRLRSVFVIGCYAAGSAIAVIGGLTSAFATVGWRVLPFTLEQVDQVILDVVFPIWALGVVVLLGRAAFRDPTSRGRLQAAVVLAGVLPWSVYMLVDWSRGFPEEVSPFFEHLLPFLVLFFPIAAFVAIFRYRLFDLPLVVRRSLLYTGVTSALVLVFYAALGAGGAFFSRFLPGERASIWSMSVATLILGLVFSPLSQAVRVFVERRFFPERQALRGRLIDLASELPALGKLDRMGEHLVRSLRQVFGTNSVTLLLTEPTSGALLRLAHSPDTSAQAEDALFLSEHDPAIVLLREAGRPLPGWDILESSPTLSQRFDRTQIELAVPLFQERRLVGILLLGGRATQARFTAEEVELLSLVAHQVATVLENVRLFQSATYEGLTGLQRREAALERLDGEVDRARRYRRPLTVALADIDHFKEVNDRFGHLEGDRVLRAVAQALQSVVRASDVVGRYGGEEFLLIFPETEIEAAAELSEKLRRRVEQLQLRTDEGSRVEVRVSIGMAALSSLSDEATITHLIASADRELYRAKATGRNRVEPRMIVTDRAIYDVERGARPQGARRLRAKSPSQRPRKRAQGPN